MNKVIDHKLLLEPPEAAACLGLRYVCDTMPGIRRRRCGSGWSFKDERGCTLRDEAVRQRLLSLAIPPAWVEVWICPFPLGHLQATGLDDRCRKQYIYHPLWEQLRNEAKFRMLRGFGSILPAIRRQIGDDLARPGLPMEKVNAAVIKLLELTGMRVGNDCYRRDNKSYGMVTLRQKHVQIQDAELAIRFIGKSSREIDLVLASDELADVIAECQELPGRELFQYLDEDGKRHALDAGDVNGYLKRLTNEAYTSKTFRTWTGTLTAALYLDEMGGAGNRKEAEVHVREAINHTAERLNNTPAICRDYYIHPAVIDGYIDGDRLHVNQFRDSKKTLSRRTATRRRSPYCLPRPQRTPARRHRQSAQNAALTPWLPLLALDMQHLTRHHPQPPPHEGAPIMARIAVLITNMFEDVEYTEPAKAFENKGHDLVHVGLEANETVKGKADGTAVVIDEAVGDVKVSDFDALLIPGGYSPDQLRVDKDAVAFTRAFIQSGKPVFSICHAPQLLITAQVLDGRKATGYVSIIQDMKNAGAQFEDAEVVVDGNLVTSRNPDDIPAFIAASLEKLNAA